MSNTVLNKIDIEKSFEHILKSLSEKEKNVIERRIGLKWEKETLQNIGNSFTPSVTRERIRQIEESGIKKIGRIVKATILTDIQTKAMEYLNLHAGVISSEKLINNIIKDLKIEDDVNKALIETVIHSDYDIEKSKQKLGCKIYFYLPKIDKKDITAVHKEAVKILKKKKDVMEKSVLLEQVVKNLNKNEINAVFVDSVLDLFEDLVEWEENLIWLTKWKILNPKTLKDKSLYILKKEKVPMHFVDIWNKITEYLWETVKTNTIHNELIRSDDFVLIGRWIYALKEWGFKPGTVIDVIISIMKKKWEPMSTEEITKEVLKERNVKKTTVYMNLQNKKIIERVGRNYYQLKES